MLKHILVILFTGIEQAQRRIRTCMVGAGSVAPLACREAHKGIGIHDMTREHAMEYVKTPQDSPAAGVSHGLCPWLE